MRKTRLYIENDIAPDSSTASKQIVTLNADDSRYLTKVMRYRSGDQIEVFNGDGNNYTASLTSVAKSVELKIESTEVNNNESPLSVTLVQGLAKGAKLDLVIQKATELGIHRISPVSTQHSVLHIEQKRASKKALHWKKIASSACAQSHRSVVPIIDPVTDLSSWLRDHSGETSILIHPRASNTFKQVASTLTENNTDAPIRELNLLVGPEGGFSESEITQALETGVSTVRCGPRVMRTETAGLAAIAIVQAMLGDLS